MINKEFGPHDFEIIKKEILYKGFSTLVRYTVKHKLFNGGWSKPYTRELCERFNAVVVLPYDPILDKVILIEQFRVGAIKDKKNPWLLEMVAGIVDKNKPLEEIARLEVKEEAGLETLSLIPIYNFWNSPGGVSENVTLFCAIVDATNAGGIHGLKEENENIKVHSISSTEAFSYIQSGLINNDVGIIALQWLELNISDIKRKYFAKT